MKKKKKAKLKNNSIIHVFLPIKSIAFRSQLPATTGIILFWIKAPSSVVVAEKVVRVIALRDDWYGHFSVVEDDKVRMRNLQK